MSILEQFLPCSFGNAQNEDVRDERLSVPDCLSVGVDVGTTNTKVALVEIGEASVRVRAVAAAPTPRPGEVAGTLSGLIRQALRGDCAPAAVGVASMAESGVPLGTDGAPVGDWLRWDGRRALAEAEALGARLGWAELVTATGVRPSAKVPLATWAWLRSREPQRWAAMTRWAGAADLVCLFLCGELVTDHTLAGRTMAYRLPAAGNGLAARFDADLLAEVGLRPEQLPRVAAPTEPAGRLTPAAAAACGLPAGIPVTVAGHDHAVGTYAAGVRSPRQVADSIGTAEAVLTIAPGALDVAAVATAGMSTVVPVTGSGQAVLAGSPGAGGLVAWWCAHEAGGCSPEELFADAHRASAGGLLVLPYPTGRQAPAPDPGARLRVLGRRPEHGRAQLARALLDGLCLQARWLVQEQGRLTGAAGQGPVTALGAALVANPAWQQVKADVLDRPLRLVAEPEAVAAGAALVAAVRAGLVPAAAAPVLAAEPIARAGPPAGYDTAFAQFVAAAGRGAAT